MHDSHELTSAMRSAHENAPQAPPFAEVWRAARERQEARRARRPRVVASVLLTATALVALLLVPALIREEPVAELSSHEYELAHALSNWEAPLDFLLEAPGGDLLGYRADTLGSTVLSDISFPDTEETLR